MALLHSLHDGTVTSPGPRLVIGRSSACGLVIDDPRVSGEHAVLAHRRGAWLLRDLGSRNGTAVDGRALAPGDAAPILKDSEIQIGGRDIALRCLDDAPPAVYAIEASGERRASLGDLLALPSDDNPLATVYRGDNDGWYLETAEDTRPVGDRERLLLEDRSFTLVLPPIASDVASTMRSSEPPAAVLEAITLKFETSPSDGLVTVIVRGPPGERVISPRTNNELLLLLARARHEDRARELGEDEEGWLYSDWVAETLLVSLEHLNVLVYRARSGLATSGVLDASKLIERRPASRQLRIGVPPSRLIL